MEKDRKNRKGKHMYGSKSFGLKFRDRILTYIDLADDLSLVTNTGQQLIDALNVLQEEAAKVELEVN